MVININNFFFFICLELIVKSENIILYKDKLKIKNLMNTNNILQDLIEKKVIGPLNFTIEINSLYSEDDEEYQLNLMFDRDFKKYKTVFSQEFNFNTPENQFLPNTYKTFNIIINDETYSLKNKQIKFEFQFSFSFLLIHRASTIIDNPIGFIKIEFDPENLKEFIRKSNFHNNNVSFNFIVINHNKKNCIKINPFNDSKNNIILNTEKSNQILLIQIIYENSLVQSYSINLSNLNISNINFHDYYTIYLFKIPIILKFSFTNENFNNDKITNIKDEISKKDFSEVKSENNNGKSKNNEEKKKKISDIEKIKLQIHSLKNENSNLSTQLLREQVFLIKILKFLTFY